jgi:hypothetical protein
MWLAAAQGASAQAPPVEIKDITAEAVQTPEFDFSGDDRRSTPGDWLVVEVEFDIGADAETVSVKYFITLRGEMQQAGQYLTGEVTHINVFEGRGKFSSIYIAPNTVKRFNGGDDFQSNDIFNVGVEISVNGRPAAVGSVERGGNERWWLEGAPISGQTLRKDQTPFAPLYWDRYEQIQPQ